MASQATIAMTLVAQTAAFDRKMKRSAKRIDRMSRSSRVAAAGLKRMKSAAIGAAAAFIGMQGIRIVTRAIASATRRSEDFNQAMLSSLAIMGDVSNMMQQRMTRAAFEAAAATKFASREIAESFFFLASAGLKAEAQIAALPLVAKFAQAGMFDMRLATDLLTDAQSALGLTVQDAQENLKNMTRIADVLVKANTQANASVQQLSESLTNKAAAAMKFLNISVEEGVAVLAAFADQGIKSANAGTAFDIVTRELTRRSIENAKAFREAGIRVFDYGGNLRNLADVTRDLEDAMAGLAPRQRQMLLAQLGFTAKSSVFIKALIGMSEKIREVQAATEDSAGFTEKVANSQLTNLTKQINITESAWTALVTKLKLGEGAAIAIEALNLSMDIFGTGMKRAQKEATKLWLKLFPLEDKARAVSTAFLDIGITIKRALGIRAVDKFAANIDQVDGVLRKGFVQARKYKDGVRAMSAQQQAAAEIAEEFAVKQHKLIETMEKQVRVFGMSERQVALYRLELVKADEATKAHANSLFNQMDAARASAKALEDSHRSMSRFTDLFDELNAAVRDFNLSSIEQEINLLKGAFTGDVMPKALIERIKRLAATLDELRNKADAFSDLKSQAMAMVRSTRTPLERFNEQVALLHKLAKAIDPVTGKPLIDTDTLNRGLEKARENLRAFKRDARDGFIQGKREFIRTLGVTQFETGMNVAKKGSPLFKQFGKTPPGGILQGAPPNLFGGGGPGRIHPRPITANTSTLAGGSAEAYLARIEALIRSGLPRIEKTRVN